MCQHILILKNKLLRLLLHDARPSLFVRQNHFGCRLRSRTRSRSRSRIRRELRHRRSNSGECMASYRRQAVRGWGSWRQESRRSDRGRSRRRKTVEDEELVVSNKNRSRGLHEAPNLHGSPVVMTPPWLTSFVNHT